MNTSTVPNPQPMPIRVETLDQLITRHMTMHMQEAVSCSTGFHSLDQAIGGLVPGRVIVVSGITNHGKTILCRNLALAAALQKKNVLFMALESNYVVLEMLACRYVHKSKEALTKNDYDSLPNMAFVTGTDLIGFETFHSILENIVAPQKVDVLIIDHLSYLLNLDKKLSTNEHLTKIMNTLATKAKESKFCVLAVSHITNTATRLMTGTKYAPDVAALKDSSSLYQAADVVLMVHRLPAKKERGMKSDLSDFGYLAIRKNKITQFQAEIPFKIVAPYQMQLLQEDLSLEPYTIPLESNTSEVTLPSKKEIM